MRHFRDFWITWVRERGYLVAGGLILFFGIISASTRKDDPATFYGLIITVLLVLSIPLIIRYVFKIPASKMSAALISLLLVGFIATLLSAGRHWIIVGAVFISYEILRWGAYGSEKKNTVTSQKQHKNGDHSVGKRLDEDAYMERIFREADARAAEEARRRPWYYIPEETRQNQEFIALLKSAVSENRLDTIPKEDLFAICKRARAIHATSDIRDAELSRIIGTLVDEINKRRVMSS
jgi:hypothetical protein